MKIHAEGYDFFALQGAAGLFSDGAVRCGQFEHGSAWRHAGATLTRAVSWLEGKGYETRLLTVRGLFRPDPERSREYFQYSNYVFARRDLAPEVFGADPRCI